MPRDLNIINPEGLRRDGRREKELRQIKCELGISSCDGSAYYSQGNTQVMAYIHGPVEANKWSDSKYDEAVIKCQFNQTNYSQFIHRTHHIYQRKAKQHSKMIIDTFSDIILADLYPRSVIFITITVLQDDGALLSCCLNATTLALIDAGIAMKDMLIACSVGIVRDQIYLDLNYNEHKNAPIGHIAMLPHSQTIQTLKLSHKIPAKQLMELIQLAEQGCQQIYHYIKHNIEDYAQQLIANQQDE